MTTIGKSVGLIANPASGKDIRRLVAYGSVFDNYEKVNIVRRVFLGLEAAGVSEVLYMPDYFNIVGKALDDIKLTLTPRPLEMYIHGNQDDTTEAARLMDEAGVACIVTLGGDGTNRAVVKGTAAVPLMPISTGTNNVFPFMIEGTLAGMAAGVLASGTIPLEKITLPTNRLDVLLDGQFKDLALVDIAIYDDTFIGSRAIWEISKVREVFLSRVESATVGLSSLGGGLSCKQFDNQHGVHIHLAAHDTTSAITVRAPIAPGWVKPVQVSGFSLLKYGDEILIGLIPSVLALDGEREIEVNGKGKVSIRLSDQGPRVIDMNRALQAATQHNFFNSVTPNEMKESQCQLAQLGICLTPCLA